MLTLPIKKKWFDMILTGEKKEEYRATTKYYTKRFQTVGLLDENGNPTGHKAFICFRNGYRKDSPEFVLMVTLKIGTGYPAWGADEDEWYYVLEILELYVPDQQVLQPNCN